MTSICLHYLDKDGSSLENNYQYVYFFYFFTLTKCFDLTQTIQLVFINQ